ncbi:MAG: hypothetical protein ACE5F1_11945 [Planctomycetota bacterium]
MRTLATLLLCLPALPMTAAAQQEPAGDAATQGGFTVPLSHRGQRKWKLRLPDEQWTPVGVAFRFKRTQGHDFKAELEGTRLVVDTDGDGTGDVKAEGKAAFLTLRGRSAGGKPTAYSVRMVNRQGWRYAPGGFVAGKAQGTPIRIIDQNNNGRFDDVGKDALIVGRGKVATFLSEVVNLRGSLFRISVAADGSELSAEPYQGPAGTLRLDCSTKGKVLSAVVRSTDHRYSFDGARAALGLAVPAGSYELYCGELGLGESRVKMLTGESRPFEVASAQTRKICWGGPVRAEFDYQRQENKVHLSPKRVWYYGALGERYVDWVPLGASPQFTITDDRTGKEVARAFFPGTC